MFRTARHAIARKIPTSVFCITVNLRNYFRGKKHRLRPYTQPNLIVASDESNSIIFCRRKRHNRYKRGINRCIDDLARDYHLDKINDLTPEGLFIDCGANVGEVGYWVKSMGLDYIAIEPEDLEADCCDLNNYEGENKTIRKALWNKNTNLQFFLNPDTADSSIFDMKGSKGTKSIEAVRLDDVLSLEDLTGTVIFKVEAEGAEPEVLEGAIKSLERIDYVALDCGYERGIEKKHTLIETNKILYESGFELIESQFKRVTMLYKNTRR